MLRELSPRLNTDIQSGLLTGPLVSSFSFIPGISSKTEEVLWHNGIFTWQDAMIMLDITRLTKLKKAVIEEYINKAVDALAENDIDFFASNLPKAELWKLYQHFKDSTVFLDIETTGLSQYYDYITLVGITNRDHQAFFIKDNNLGDLQEYIKNYKILVTFNGTTFDIPFIKQEFGGIALPPIHIDLRYLLRSIGKPGPLKKVEKQLGLERPESLNEVDGREATILWRRFINGDNFALATLLEYNAYDTENMAYLLDYCCKIKSEDMALKMQGANFQLRMGETPQIPALLSKKSEVRNPEIEVLQLDTDSFTIRTTIQEVKINRQAIKRPEIKINEILHELHTLGKEPLSIGLDLSGSEQRPTGVCVLRGQEAVLSTLYTDSEMISLIRNTSPAVVSIDSPLTLPQGRCCVKDSCDCRRFGIMRQCERTLKKRGINVYPCLIPSMQGLTARGIELAKKIRELGIEVIESYPGAAQDIMGLPRKRADLTGLKVDLINMGIEPKSDEETVSHHEIDALTSALVGYFYLAGQFEALGNEDEEYLIIPSFSESKANG